MWVQGKQLTSRGVVLRSELRCPTHTAPSISNDEVVMVQPGLDDVRIGHYLANGNGLFCDNQCVLDLVERGTSLALGSVTISNRLQSH